METKVKTKSVTNTKLLVATAFLAGAAALAALSLPSGNKYAGGGVPGSPEVSGGGVPGIPRNVEGGGVPGRSLEGGGVPGRR